MKFATNMGMADRAIRLVLGVVLIAIALTGVSAWGWIGVIPLVTAFVKFCPIYAVLGLKTCQDC
jgi:hypothetical protein